MHILLNYFRNDSIKLCKRYSIRTPFLILKIGIIFIVILIQFICCTYGFSDAHSTQAGISLSLSKFFLSFEFEFGFNPTFETLYCLSHICLSIEPPLLALFSFEIVYVRFNLFVNVFIILILKHINYLIFYQKLKNAHSMGTLWFRIVHCSILIVIIKIIFYFIGVNILHIEYKN